MNVFTAYCVCLFLNKTELCQSHHPFNCCTSAIQAFEFLHICIPSLIHSHAVYHVNEKALLMVALGYVLKFSHPLQS